MRRFTLTLTCALALIGAPAWADESEPKKAAGEESKAPEPEEDVADDLDEGLDQETPNAKEKDDDLETGDTLEPRDEEDEAKRSRAELAQPRPPLPDVVLPSPPKWKRRLEIGVDLAYVHRPFSGALADTAVRYESTIAWGLHLSWDVLSWLRFHPYFIDAHHTLVIPPGALATSTPSSISASATIATERVATFVFGARIAPTWRFTERARGWISVGVGWGRFEFPRMTVTETSGAVFEIRERNGVFAEVPLGVGVSFDVIPRWLAIEYEATGAAVFGQSGPAHEVFQAVDADGNTRDVAAFGAIEASFVQTIGLSLIL